MNKTTITDAAREAAWDEFDNIYDNDGDKAGHFVQQLLDAEREKWEALRKKMADSILNYIVEADELRKLNESLLLQNKSLVEQRDSSNEKLNDAQDELAVAQDSLTVAYLCGLHSKTCVHHTDKERQQDPGCIVCLIKDRDQLRQQLLEHKAAIAVKDEALRETVHYLYKIPINAPRGLLPLCEGQFKKWNAALSPNCGQPLMELQRKAAALDKIEKLCDKTPLAIWKGEWAENEQNIRLGRVGAPIVTVCTMDADGTESNDDYIGEGGSIVEAIEKVKP